MVSISQEPRRDYSGPPDAHMAELIETVWACERAARLEDRIDALVAAAARYALPRRRR